MLSVYYSALRDSGLIDKYKRGLYKLPIQNNKIVFDSFLGQGYGENPKYIAEALQKRDGRIKIIWLTNDKTFLFPKGVKPITRNSFRAYYECATAKAWVFNTRQGKLLEKRKGQIFLQTWHGGIALKKVEMDAADKLTDSYISAAKYDGESADGIIVDGKLNEELFETSFWLSPRCERLKIGQPRIDVLLNERDNQEIHKKVREKLEIQNGSFFVLYAPTFRRFGSVRGYITDFSMVKKAFEDRFGKVTIAVRLHPNAVSLVNAYKNTFGDEIVNATSYPDAQELIIAADCVISDYSSIAYDFAIMRKPVFLLTKDTEDYKQERGVYDVFYDQPFVMNNSEEMLAAEIRSFSYDDMIQRIDRFYAKYPTYNRGDASERAVDWLIAKGLDVKR